jgi:hypothetical protein
MEHEAIDVTKEKLAAERLTRERAQVKFGLSAERILGELARIALANMQDYVTAGPDGETLHRPSSSVPRPGCGVAGDDHRGVR